MQIALEDAIRQKCRVSYLFNNLRQGWEAGNQTFNDELDIIDIQEIRELLD